MKYLGITIASDLRITRVDVMDETIPHLLNTGMICLVRKDLPDKDQNKIHYVLIDENRSQMVISRYFDEEGVELIAKIAIAVMRDEEAKFELSDIIYALLPIGSEDSRYFSDHLKLIMSSLADMIKHYKIEVGV
ncbi:MAG: hypothetical protein R3B38_01365 [Patescibacteria group bacterium]